MEQFKSLESMASGNRPYRNVSEPRTVKEIITEVLTQPDSEVPLETLYHLSTMIRRDIMETPPERRDPLKVSIWEFYKETCQFWESFEDWQGRIIVEHGVDYLFKFGIK